ncbi:MAG: homoserine kinase [Burkholderiales bacterium]|nr:homoserine kinase [Burkholderiales bacterium]
MSVFTPVSVDEARAFVAPYHVGDIIDFQNIAAGVENSNFFVTTTQGRYVLTIFEKIPRADLDFYMGLMAHLHANGIACAAPLVTADGVVLGTLHGKPAALVTRLAGNDIAHPTPEDCFAVGAALARMHAAAQTFPLKMANWRGLSWWKHYAADLAAHLATGENDLLAAELAYQAGFDALGLPRGVIHGDLFRDNILWDDHGTHHTPQMIDFYFACDEQLMFDVAVTVNDWCLDFSAYPEARLNVANTRALLQGYASVRHFTAAECGAWPQMLRAAVMRTWLGRLGYHHFPRDSELTHPKDHPYSERLLRHHIEHAARNAALIQLANPTA